MSGSLNVIALVSGGKDSLFSMLHCIENGHKIVALANLHPSHPTEPQDDTPEGSDLNSFMYQTVGHSLIPLYATALQLPLYRWPITGTSVQQSQYYDASALLLSESEADETEDLIPLLRQVIRSHPEANAISTGAILSTYQRTRVESVALRLSLTPVGYLWQYPVLPPPAAPSGRLDSLTALLEDMKTSGMEARIIKIASAGIPDSLLFSNVADPRTQSQLLRGLSPFFEDDELGLRGAILGEGGEYETLALNGPKLLWKGGKIEVDETSNNSYTEAGVTYLRFGKARVVPQSTEEEQAQSNGSKRSLVQLPGLFDQQFVLVRNYLQLLSLVADTDMPNKGPALVSGVQDTPDIQSDPRPMQALRLDRGVDLYQNRSRWTALTDLSYTSNSQFSTIVINNLTSASILSYLRSHKFIAPPNSTISHHQPVVSTLSSAADQLQTILSSLSDLLNIISISHSSLATATARLSLKLTHITSALILLSDMSDFPTINPIYSSGIWPLGLPNPPARVTIAAPLPEHTKISLSLKFDICENPLSRQGLHVQGRSYWAPANIGPYSQAITVPLAHSSRTQAQRVSSTRVNDDGTKAVEETDDSNPCTGSGLQTVHIAGQIPLVPASMDLYQGSFSDSAVLSLQHLWRVGQERGVDAWPWGIALLAEHTDNFEYDREHAAIAGTVWRRAHLVSGQAADSESDDRSESSESEEQAVDIWDLRHNMAANPSRRFGATGSTVATKYGKHVRSLPNHDIFQHARETPTPYYVPPFVAAEVDSLPRNASVEWWSEGFAGLMKSSSSSSSSTVTPCYWRYKSLAYGSLSCLTILPNVNKPYEAVNFITYLISSLPSRATASSTIEDHLPTTPMDILRELHGGSDIPSSIQFVHGTAFTSISAKAQSDHEPSMLQFSLQKLVCSMTTIPCHRLWGYSASSTTKISRYQEREDRDSTLTSEFPDCNSQKHSSLLAALLLRVDVGP